uniref:Ata8 protein n=1 Tax=Saccharothrix mutabilis subsp. capreolus TaxID=66854 RepID=Q83W11_STRMP|nr:Ata8 protein [Saccharothrix mutabilis subsp. capreolus]
MTTDRFIAHDTGSGADIASEVVATDVGALALPRDDGMMLPWFRRHGWWEPHESRLVESLLYPGDTFVDVGAHIGYHTLRALRRVGPAGAVFAIEPWAPLRDLLRRNVAANVPELAGALSVVEGAAWHTDMPLRLRLDPRGNTGDSRVGTSGGPLEVPGVRLGGLAELRARRPALIKTDIQGRDHHALTGLADLLLRDRPHVLCEFWPHGIRDDGSDPAEVLRLYRSWGYEPKLVREAYACPEFHACVLSHRDDAEYIALAEQSRGGFATLWLCPRP